jgi:hypothetical protein
MTVCLRQLHRHREHRRHHDPIRAKHRGHSNRENRGISGSDLLAHESAGDLNLLVFRMPRRSYVSEPGLQYETFKTVVCDIRSSPGSRASVRCNLRSKDTPIGQEILHALFD